VIERVIAMTGSGSSTIGRPRSTSTSTLHKDGDLQAFITKAARSPSATRRPA
jgi:hypothetical protein